RPEGVKTPERAIAEREEREGENERGAEAQAIGQRAAEEREQVDQRTEQSGHEAGLHVVQPHHAQQVGAKGDERAVVGGALAQLRGIREPERAGEAPGGFLGSHFDSGVGCGRGAACVHMQGRQSPTSTLSVLAAGTSAERIPGAGGRSSARSSPTWSTER